MTLTADKPLTELKDFVGYVKYEILEDNKSSGRMRVSGIFQRADTKNANGRIYTSALWERLLGDQKLKHSLQNRGMLGMVEHPQSGLTNLSLVSHVVTGLTRKGDIIYGEAEILNTPSGKVIQELFRAGCPVGISSRGRGTSTMRGGNEYVDESTFQLDTFDFVYKPSTPGAYPELQEALKESIKGPYRQDSQMNEKLDELKRLEVRAMDLAKSVTDPKANLKANYQESLEVLASVETLLAQVSGEKGEEANEENQSYAMQVLDKASKAKIALAEKLDAIHLESDLDRRIDNVMDDAAEAEEPVAPAAQKKESNSAQVASPLLGKLKDLLKETREERDYFRKRLLDTMNVLESSDNELQQRLAAAYKLGDELVARLQSGKSALTTLGEEHEALKKRYDAAVKLVAEVVERHDRAQLVKRIREAIEDYPELAKFQKSLLSCKTVEELEERLAEYVEALDLPAQDKEEALTSQVVIGTAKGSTESEEEGEDGDAAPETDESDDSAEDDGIGESAELPTKGASINESTKPTTGPRRLDESHEDRGVATARAAINLMRGWK